MNSVEQDKFYLKKGKSILLIGIGATICSYIYVLLTEEFNGDFSGELTKLTPILLFILLLITLLPYLFTLKLFKKYAFYPINTIGKINLKPLKNITWFFILCSILMKLSGYGVMGGGEVGVNFSDPISVIQMLIYKFSNFPWLYIYIFAEKKKKNIIITLCLQAIAVILSHSIGGLYILFLIVFFKFNFIYINIKKHWLAFCFFLIIFPTIVQFLYNFRTQLRHGRDLEETTSTDLIFNRLSGRISSYSNNGFILENVPLVVYIQNRYPNDFLFLDALNFFGIHRANYKSVGKIVESEIIGHYDSNYSVMAGFGGVLILSAVKSPVVLILNLALIALLMWLEFRIPYKLKFFNSTGISLIKCFMFCTSCDIRELSVSIIGFFIIYIFIKIFCIPKTKSKIVN